MAKEFVQAEYDTMQKNLSVLDATITKLNAEANKYGEEAKTEESKRTVNYSQAALNGVLARYNGILADFAKHGISLNSFVGSIAGLLSQDDGELFMNRVFNNISTVVSQAGEQMIPQLLKQMTSTLMKLPKDVVLSFVDGIKSGIK